jgi:site-specific DNA-methyltransferase (adenine-specific)
MTSLPFTSILYGTRLRRDYPEVEQLADSIRDNGIIHPITVASNESDDGSVQQYELIAGGRRYNAYVLLRQRHPGEYDNIPVTLRSVASLSDLRLLELEENFRREDMTWQESTLGIFDYHRLANAAARQKDQKWTQSMTAKLAGVSQTQISFLLNVAECLKANDEAVWKTENLSGAVQLLLKRKADEAQAERMRRIESQRTAQIAQLSSQETTTGGAVRDVGSTVSGAAVEEVRRASDASSLTEVDFDELEVRGLEVIEEIKELEKKKEERALTIKFPPSYLRSLFRLGDCITEMRKMKSEGILIDHIITDPPYAIDMANLDTIANIDTVADTHHVQQNLDQFEPFLRASFDLLPDHGFLAMWYDLDHHEKLVDLGKKVGFKVQRWPLVWCKTTPCSNSAAQYNFTKSTEVCLVLRKSASGILAQKQPNNFILEPNTKDARHPFAKPFKVWERLVLALSLEGQTILDPFAGSGSSTYAALASNRLALGIEVDERHIYEAVELLGEKLNRSLGTSSSNAIV